MPNPSCQGGAGKGEQDDFHEWSISAAGSDALELLAPRLSSRHVERPPMTPQSPGLGVILCRGCCTALPSPGPTEHRPRCSRELGHSPWDSTRASGSEPPHSQGMAHGESPKCRGSWEAAVPTPASVTAAASLPLFSPMQITGGDIRHLHTCPKPGVSPGWLWHSWRSLSLTLRVKH